MGLAEKRDVNWYAALLHQEKYGALSELRVTMIAYGQVLRGTINASESEYLWVSGEMQAALPALLHIDTDLVTNTDVSRRGRAAFLVPQDTFNACDTVGQLWPVGRLAMLGRSPRNQDARQQMAI
jgi:hypothetical protein